MSARPVTFVKNFTSLKTDQRLIRVEPTAQIFLRKNLSRKLPRNLARILGAPRFSSRPSFSPRANETTAETGTEETRLTTRAILIRRSSGQSGSVRCAYRSARAQSLSGGGGTRGRSADSKLGTRHGWRVSPLQMLMGALLPPA